jgi:hypothetical protein
MYGFHKKAIGTNHQITAIIGEDISLAPNPWIFLFAL